MANPFDQFDPPAAPLDPRKPARAPSQSGNPFYDAVRDAVSPLGGRITSTNGGRHNVGSEHYSGRAVDVGMGRETPEQQESIKSALEAAGYRVRDERSRPAGQAVWSGPHLHVSMDGGGSGGGGAMGAADANPFAQPSAQGGNPFDQFDGPAEDPVAAFRQINAARQPAAPAVAAPTSQPASDLGNIVSGFSTSESPEPAAPTSDQRYRPGSLVGKVIASLSNAVPGGGLLSDETIKAADGYAGFDPSTPTGIPEAPALQRGDYVDMGLRSIVRVPDLAGSLIDLIPDAGDAAVRALGGSPEKSVSLSLMRHGLGFVSDAAHQPTRMADEMGFGLPSVDAGQALDAVDPRTNIPIGDRLSSLARFIPETLVGSGGDMAAAVSAPYLYMGARTDEIARNRAANDKRANVSATDLAAAAPAAAIETMLEKFTTGRLLPGGGAHLPASTLAEALTRVAKETGLQAASGGVEEVVPYLAENAGTQTGANARDALAQAFGGALSEGALGAAVDAPSQLASLARPKPKANVSPEAQAPTEQQAVNPARVAAEKPVEAAPRPESAVAATAKAAPQTEAAEAPPAESTRAAPSRPDMDAATKAIDTRLAALDESARAALPESKVSELNAERQQLDDLVREQDRAKREGIILSPENRLTADERAQADARRAEIAAELERHRAARSAADQADRLRNRLDNIDTDAGLFEVAREIDPTLGTTQAESFRSSEVKNNSTPEIGPSSSAAIATPSVSEAGSTTPLPDTPSVAAKAPASTSRTEPQQNQDVLSNSLNQKEITTQKASQKAPDVADQRGVSLEAPAAVSEPARAEAPRQPAAGTGDLRNSSNPAPRPESQREPAPPSAPEAPARTTSLKNAVTDAERVAEGRDPIIREARKANRKTVDEAVSAIRENPSIGRETAQRLAEGGPVELKDEAVLLVHKVDLRKRRDAAAERAQDPNASEHAREIARREYDDAVQQIDEVDQAASRIGTESGRLLQLRKRMIAEDYSLPALERKLRMVVNRDLKPAERAELAEMAEKVATLQRKLDAAESQQASAQVAEMLARLMQQAPGRNATLAERRAAAAESRAALSAMAAGRGGQRSVQADRGEPGQARAALADRFGRGVIRALERDGVLKFEGAAGGSWDGATIRIGDVRPENAVGVLLHEASHARLAEVLGPKAYDTALRDLDALEAAGDAVALKAARRAARSGETGARLDDERLAYLVEEAAKANRTTGGVSGKVRELARRLLSAFRQWAATSPVFRALERIGAPRPTLQPEDFVGFAEASLRQLQRDAAQPEARRLRGKIGALETELRTDRLTGMRNKRAFDEDAELGWPAVVAIDMDGLKRLNDAIGHEAADNVMRALADELRGAEGDGARFYRRSGDEFAARFRDPADAETTMRALQDALEGMQVQLDVADADGRVRSYTYEGIGISYGTGATYETADAAANRQKQTRLEAGLREQPRADGPSRRLREDSPRPGGRRAGDPPAVEAQRSVPDGLPSAGEMVSILRNHPFTRLRVKPKRVFVVGSTAAKAARPDSDIDVVIEVSGNAEELQAAYRKRAADYFIKNNIRGRLDEAHPQWDGRRVDVYFVEDAEAEAAGRPMVRLQDAPQRSIPESEVDAGAQVPAGADPVAFFHLARMGAFHYADGARDVAEWTRRMEADLGAAAGQYRGMLPDAFKAAQAQATRPTRGQESVAEAVEAIGDQRRPRDVKRVVRAVVAEGMRGEDQVFEAAAQALDMDTEAVRALFVQPEPGPRTLSEAQAELKELRKALRRENARPAKEAKAAIRRDQKEMREAQREALRPDPETRYQNQRARDFQRRIADLEERIAAGDFAKPEKVEHQLTERNERLRFELEKTKERFHRFALESEFQNRTPIGKIFGETVAGINFARAVMTSLDLSAVLRQGGFISLGNPVRAMKAFPGSLRAFVSENANFRIRQEIENRPNAPLYKKFGLELTGIGGDVLTRTEENYASRWVDKVPSALGGGLIRGSGRSYTAFLNRLRADSFDAMLAALARDGSNPTKEEGKAIANYINVATGRGKVGMNEKSGEVLNTVFFAPRLVASRFQLLAGQPLYGGSNRTRRMIAIEYARFMMGASVAIALALMMRDPDDETKAIELDPRSANFGKVRFGDTYLDPLAGLAQVTVFLARVASGETRTTTKGELKPLRDSYRLTDAAPGLGDGYELGKTGYGGRDVPNVITSFLRSKLAPVPGAIVNLATGKNMIGQEVTPMSAAGELVTPMSVGSIVDIMESQGMARGTAINLLGLLGMSVQYRKSDAEKAAEDANGIPGKLGFGTAGEGE